jgi:hypothetical protein
MIDTRAKMADPTSSIERCRRIVRTRFALGTSGSVGSARLPAFGAATAAPARAVPAGPPAPGAPFLR